MPDDRTVRVLAFGDSLTAGYGLPRAAGFAPQLQEALARRGIDSDVINAGVSGNTTANGRARIRWTLDSLKERPDLAIVALGANDLLRGYSPAQTRADLEAVLAEIDRRSIPMLVAGMLAPPLLGSRYANAFNAIFPDLARQYRAPLYPFFLAGVAGNPELNLPDRVHPNPHGVKKMVEGILPLVVDALSRRLAARLAQRLED